jgi:hypothetical protein
VIAACHCLTSGKGAAASKLGGFKASGITAG